ncbi:hypothetical protein B4U80_02463 [Leptotrombidium deliense]|uniref:TRAF3-interacting protein 1 n=1 Tax=Leptotrombidium deliense TaxID=299467 RepID=A0A443SG15_9ACAR|nr:hypothetical protein B4U80_02463 [Leptotrombidium deliense]
MAAAVDVDPKVIKLTQESLGKVIKKPPLTEKLLKRPPFKYLHDIVISIIRTTGFMSDLFQSDELIVENIKDKETKIAFLEKIIDVLGFLNDGQLNVKAAKIVAGLEPEKTNEFLQVLGNTVASKKESTNAVQKVLNGEKPSKANNSNSTKTQPMKKASKGKVAPSATTKRAVSNERRSSLAKPSEPQRNRSPLRASNKQSSKSKSPSPTTANSKAAPAPSSASSNKENPTIKEVPGELKEQVSIENTTAPVVNGTHEVKESSQPPANRPRAARSAAKKEVPHLIVRPPTGNVKYMQKHFENEEEEEERKPVARPTTARAAPPKVVSQRELEEKSVDIAVEEEKRRLLSAKPVENLITEKDDEGDDDLFLVEEAKPGDEAEETLREKVNSYDTGSDQKGSLVQQLVATKKELEGEKDKDSAISSGDETMTKLAVRDIEKLKEGIQMLTRLANPLGRVLDYLQEDVDSMISELKSWEEEYQNNVEQLQKEKSVVDNDLISLRAELEAIDREISEQLEKITMSKANIIRKEDTLQRLVDMVVEKGA